MTKAYNLLLIFQTKYLNTVRKLLKINLCRPFSLTAQIVPQHLVIQNKLKPDKNMK